MKLILTNAKGEQVAEYRAYTTEGFFDVLLLASATAEKLARQQCAADPHERSFSHCAMLTMESGHFNGRPLEGVHVVYDATWARADEGGPAYIAMGKPRSFPESDFAGALEYLMGC